MTVTRQPFQSTLFLVATLMAFELLALLAVVLVSNQAVDRISGEKAHEVQEALRAVEQSYHLQISIERQSDGLQGFAATGDGRLLRPWYRGSEEFARTLHDLEAANPPPSTRKLLERVKLADARIQSYGVQLLTARRENNRPQIERLLVERGPVLKAQAVAAVEALSAAERERVSQANAESAAVEEQVRWQMLLSTAISVPITILLAVSIVWRVFVPMRQLAGTSRAIARGDLHVRVPYQRHDEFAEVASTFNYMAETVEATLKSLQETNEDLRRVDRYKDDFLSMVTHELKTPLTAILGFATMLGRGSNGQLSASQGHSVDKIVSNALRMQALVSDLLDSTAIRQGRLDLILEPTAYRPLLDDALAHMRALADAKGITLELEAAGEASPMIDADRIRQVLTNLLGNALRFTPEGGLITLHARIEGPDLITEVRDTGTGIAEDDQPGLFIPFSPLAKSSGGTGLGLSICRAIVEGHGGRIGVESRLRAGSRFYFTLPLRREDG